MAYLLMLACVLGHLLPAHPDNSREDSSTSSPASASDVPHSRQKRVLWITNDGRLALPPGTTMILTPSISMPFIRNPVEGFFSNVTISLPFTVKADYKCEFKVDFDKLGLTDNENPYGALPPFFSRSLGRAAGGLVADFIGKYLDMRRSPQHRVKRETMGDVFNNIDSEKMMTFLHGGERALLFGAVEDFLSNFGLAGKPCLLRAICEVHAHPLKNFGLIGEMVKLFLTASKSPYSHLLDEYVSAERAGTGDQEGPAECWPYYKECPKSLFMPNKNKYTEDAEEHHVKEEKEEARKKKIENQEISNEFTYDYGSGYVKMTTKLTAEEK